jgi:hypothetical protein
MPHQWQVEKGIRGTADGQSTGGISVADVGSLMGEYGGEFLLVEEAAHSG